MSDRAAQLFGVPRIRPGTLGKWRPFVPRAGARGAVDRPVWRRSMTGAPALEFTRRHGRRRSTALRRLPESTAGPDRGPTGNTVRANSNRASAPAGGAVCFLQGVARASRCSACSNFCGAWLAAVNRPQVVVQPRDAPSGPDPVASCASQGFIPSRAIGGRRPRHDPSCRAVHRCRPGGESHGPHRCSG
jgi:hypothetical protein